MAGPDDTYDPKLSEVEGEEREQLLGYVRGRWAQFAEALREARLEATKFIALINAGGAATVLAFMGAVIRDDRPLAASLELRLALVSFVLGVALCGFAHAVQYRRLSKLFRRWRTDVAAFYAENLGFGTMQREDVKRADARDFALWLIWSALSAFLVGAALGVTLLFGGTAMSDKPRPATPPTAPTPQPPRPQGPGTHTPDKIAPSQPPPPPPTPPLKK